MFFIVGVTYRKYLLDALAGGFKLTQREHDHFLKAVAKQAAKR